MLVYYNGQVGYAPTLQGALAQVFGASSTPAPASTSPPTSGGGTPANATVVKYLDQAETYYSDAQADLRNDNLTAYASDIAKMKAALDNATKAAHASPTPAPSPSPSPSPGSSASP
jgi:uncharacterized membrane protein (UPF0182 family)